MEGPVAVGVADGSFAATARHERSGALFLRDEEEFVFDFGGAAAAQREEGGAHDGLPLTRRPAAAAAEGRRRTGDCAALATATSFNTPKQIAVVPLGAKEVRRRACAALAAGDKIFVRLSLDEAILKFQLGMRRYSEALHKQTRQQRLREKRQYSQRRK